MENNVEIQIPQSDLSDVFIDSALECKVTACLRGDDRLNSEVITVQVKDRSVYLEGSVPVEDERDLAMQCVENILGAARCMTISHFLFAFARPVDCIAEFGLEFVSIFEH